MIQTPCRQQSSAPAQLPNHSHPITFLLPPNTQLFSFRSLADSISIPQKLFVAAFLPGLKPTFLSCHFLSKYPFFLILCGRCCEQEWCCNIEPAVWVVVFFTSFFQVRINVILSMILGIVDARSGLSESDLLDSLSFASFRL